MVFESARIEQGGAHAIGLIGIELSDGSADLRHDVAKAQVLDACTRRHFEARCNRLIVPDVRPPPAFAQRVEAQAAQDHRTPGEPLALCRVEFRSLRPHPQEAILHDLLCSAIVAHPVQGHSVQPVAPHAIQLGQRLRVTAGNTTQQPRAVHSAGPVRLRSCSCRIAAHCAALLPSRPPWRKDAIWGKLAPPGGEHPGQPVPIRATDPVEIPTQPQSAAPRVPPQRMDGCGYLVCCRIEGDRCGFAGLPPWTGFATLEVGGFQPWKASVQPTVGEQAPQRQPAATMRSIHV